MKWLYFIGPVVLIVIWVGLSALELVSPLFLPSPFNVAIHFGSLFADAEIWADIGSSLYLLVVAFSISVFIGVPVGFILGSSKWLSMSTEVIIDFFRSIPASALFPLFILFFGIGNKGKIAVVVFSCSLIIVVNTIYGVRSVREARLRAARAMKASRIQIFRKIVFPEALPHIFAGLRISVSIALILVVVTEMFIGTQHGLGRRIYDAHLLFRVPEMYCVIIITGLLGYGFNKIFLLIESRLFHWVGK